MSTQYSDVNFDEVKLSPPRVSKNAAGFKSSYIQYKGQKLTIQTPVMKLPWDIKPKQMDENSNVSANLSLSFTGVTVGEKSCELNKFMAFMRQFDQKVKQLVVDMKGALGKKSEEKLLESNFRESVKESASGEYPPTIQPKIWLRCRDGGSAKCVEDHDMDIAVYDMDRKMVAPENLQKGCIAAAIIEPNTVWCSSMGIGITWVARQVIVKPMIKEDFAFSIGEQHDVLRREDSALSDSDRTAKRPRTQDYNDGDELSEGSRDVTLEQPFEEF